MQTHFRRLSWNRILHTFRRRKPTTPIRRKPVVFQLERLDDRVAPGSVFATAAAQAVALSGPLAWMGLTEPELNAVSPTSTISRTTPSADDASISDDQPAFPPAVFSLTSPDAAGVSDSATSQQFANVDSVESAGSMLNDLGDPGESATPSNPITASLNDAGSSSGGGSSSMTAPGGATRTGGVAVSGGLPAQPMNDTGAGNSPSPFHGRSGGSATASAPVGQPSNIASSPNSPSMPAPSGHFGAELQTLFNAGNSSGTFNLSDTANQQSQIGALIGGQLTSATSLGAGASASHRSASLLGQTLSAGSNQNLGLRTSPSSSGMFNLVGSHSIGSLLNGPAPNNGGGLAAAIGTVSSAVPAGNLPGLPNGGKTSIPDPAAGLPGATLTPLPRRPSAYSDDVAGVSSPGQFDADFLLTIQGGDPDYDKNGTGTPPWSVTEDGTISFLGLQDEYEHGYSDNGDNYIFAEFNAVVSVYSSTYTGQLGLNWSGLATPAGLLLGFDIDQFNLQAFGVADVNASSYVIDAMGNIPFTSTDTSTPTEQDGTVTTTNQNNFTTNGTDLFTVHVEGDGANHQITYTDNITSTTTGSDNGTDTDSAAAPGTNSDNFSDSSTDAHTETDITHSTLDMFGNSQVTSFSIDSTDDTDFTDSDTGHASQPESGGSENDTFTNSDNGHDHEHLVVSGTTDNWTASIDDTTNDYFNDGDNGSDTSSQSTEDPTTDATTTDTNADGFQSGDNGTESETLHIEGNGNATTFTATAISDRIEDVYNFTDSDTGTSGETTSTDGDTDQYGATDNGNADEVLNITGDANNLTAAYTDGVTDGFTDSDNIHDNWNGPDSAGTGTDGGTDHSTDGDNGSETVNLSANATLPNWQSTDSQGDTPDWQITNVNGTVVGTANVNSGDDGTDTDTNAANTSDTDTDHFTDTSTGTETFSANLSGDGTLTTLQQSTTEKLTTHTEDDNTSHWNDPAALDGEAATDVGSDEIDNINNDAPTLTAGQTDVIAADGTDTITSQSTDLTDTGTIHSTNVGSDDNAADAVDDTDNVNDSSDLGVNLHIHTVPDANGGQAVTLAEHANGTVSLDGGDSDTDDVNPDDEDTDTDSATCGGPVGADIQASGNIDGDQIQMAPPAGNISVDIDGTVTQTQKQTLVSPPNSPLSVPLLENSFRVDGLGTLAFTMGSQVPDPAPSIGAPIFPNGPASATVTITHTVSVPSFHIDEDADEIAGNWTPEDFDAASEKTDVTTTAGTYTNCMFTMGFSGSGTMTDSTETVTADDDEDGNAADVEGSETVTHTIRMTVDGTLNGGDISDATAHADANLTDVKTITGDEVPGEASTEQATETEDATGTGHYTYRIPWTHSGTQGNGHGILSSTTTSVRDYHVTVNDDGVQSTVTYAGGMDSVSLAYHYITTAAGTRVSYGFNGQFTQSHSDGGDGEVAESVTYSSSWHQVVKDLASGNATPFNSSGIPITSTEENVWDRALNPFTSAPDINPDSIGEAGFLTGLIPIYGNARNMINNFQNGRIMSGLVNAAFLPLDIIAVGSVANVGKKAVTWTGAKVFGEAVAEKATSEAANAAAKTAATVIPKEGIYEFTAASGKTYVGQSGNIPSRIQQHLKSGKLLQQNLSSLQTSQVLGGKTVREVAEQLKILLRGGVENLENVRNPIGPGRASLLPQWAKDLLGY